MLGPLKQHARTHQARIIFLEDRGSKLAKEEWAEWRAMSKSLDYQVKQLQKERDQAGSDAAAAAGAGVGAVPSTGGAPPPPPPSLPLSVELVGDKPMTLEAFRELAG